MLYVSWKKYVCLNFQQLKQNGVLLFNFFRGKGAPPEQVNQFDCQFESCFHRFQTPQQVGNSTSRHVQDFGWEKRSPLSLLELQFIEAFLEGVWGSFKRHLFGPFFWGMEKNICGKMMIDVIWVLNYTKFYWKFQWDSMWGWIFLASTIEKKGVIFSLSYQGHSSQEMIRTILLIGSVGVWSWLTNHSLLKLIAKAPEKWWQTETIWLPFGIRRVFFVKGDVRC